MMVSGNVRAQVDDLRADWLRLGHADSLQVDRLEELAVVDAADEDLHECRRFAGGSLSGTAVF